MNTQWSRDNERIFSNTSVNRFDTKAGEMNSSAFLSREQKMQNAYAQFQKKPKTIVRKEAKPKGVPLLPLLQFFICCVLFLLLLLAKVYEIPFLDDLAASLSLILIPFQ